MAIEIPTPFSVEDIPIANVEEIPNSVVTTSGPHALLATLEVAWAVVIVVTEVVLLFFLLQPGLRAKFLRREVSRLFVVHLMYQVLLTGFFVWLAYAWVVGGNVVCPDIFCRTETGYDWRGLGIILLGIPGLIGTLGKRRFLTYWNWAVLAGVVSLGVWSAFYDIWAAIPYGLPAAISFAVAVSTPTLLVQSQPTTDPRIRSGHAAA